MPRRPATRSWRSRSIRRRAPSPSTAAPGRRGHWPAWRSRSAPSTMTRTRGASPTRRAAAGVPVNVVDNPGPAISPSARIVNLLAARDRHLDRRRLAGVRPGDPRQTRDADPRGFARWAEMARRWRSDLKASGLSFNAKRRFWQSCSPNAPSSIPTPSRRASTMTCCWSRPAPRASASSAAPSRWSAPAPAIQSF